MLTIIERELSKYSNSCDIVRNIVRDTKWALDDVHNKLDLNGIQDDSEDMDILTDIEQNLKRKPAMIIFGQNCHTKALLVNSILGQMVLPLYSYKWRCVVFIYGCMKRVRLTLNNEFEMMDRLKADSQPWITIPEDDLQRMNNEHPSDLCPALEVVLNHDILRHLNIIIPPDCDTIQDLPEILKKYTKFYQPIVLHAINDGCLCDFSIQQIRIIKEIYHIPILFVNVTHNETTKNTNSMTESEQDFYQNEEKTTQQNKFDILKQKMLRLDLIQPNDEVEVNNADLILLKKVFNNHCSDYNCLVNETDFETVFLNYFHTILQRNIGDISMHLMEIHNKYLKHFILSAFDMARDIQITPKRLLYAQQIEFKLYRNLMKMAGEQHNEITRIIQRTLHEMKSNLHDILDEYHLKENTSPHTATMEIQQLVLKRLCYTVAREIVESVGCLQEYFTGTLQRCLESLEKKTGWDSDCNMNPNSGNGNNLLASDAVKQIVSIAYNIDLKSSPRSFSILHTVMNRIRTIVQHVFTPWLISQTAQKTNCDFDWCAQVVNDILDSLSSAKLAKAISIQFQDNIKASHEAFQTSMKTLENQLHTHLIQTEEQRIVIRKRYAPRFARLSLESTSLCDFIMWGMPKHIKEIGRGQYGVVSSCESWAGINPCAIKSVVPPDDRQWNDLAMEFYYARSIPDHPRIMKLCGSVIDYNYGNNGNCPAVLLIVEQMSRDLHCGLQSGLLTWLTRLQIAIDVVEGIRYLHSQGLVHRDIKLKNVLLDSGNRAKLADFGFCIPEAMMSGSVVGTPVHMAPELLTGHYDSSVDVYAFGILFWYLCAGQVRLPNQFDRFHDKEQLWNNVQQGTRPEYLPHFHMSCWHLMEQCWAAEPHKRPLLGYVHPQLEKIYQNAKKDCTKHNHNTKVTIQT